MTFYPKTWVLLISFLLVSFIIQPTSADVITPCSNEISFYKNVDDLGEDRGTTLQIVSINAVNLGTEFIFEFTGDFNWDLDLYEDYDYYFELSVVKPVFRDFSVNYQRIYGTFYNEPINQFGIRLSLFTK